MRGRCSEHVEHRLRPSPFQQLVTGDSTKIGLESFLPDVPTLYREHVLSLQLCTENIFSWLLCYTVHQWGEAQVSTGSVSHPLDQDMASTFEPAFCMSSTSQKSASWKTMSKKVSQMHKEG